MSKFLPHQGHVLPANLLNIAGVLPTKIYEDIKEQVERYPCR
jgi:hypothetical protein